MVENRYRHLPVVDSNGTVVGMFNIAKCLNDTISKLKRSYDKIENLVDDVVHQMTSSPYLQNFLIL